MNFLSGNPQRHWREWWCGSAITLKLVRRILFFLEGLDANSIESSIDAGVIYKLQQWLGRYLDYIATANQQLVVDSCRLNLVFWLTFPRIITAMAAHK